jgi:hypothetical protein
MVQQVPCREILSAIDRYIEINRVMDVLDSHLAQQKEKYGESGDGPSLAGNRFPYAVCTSREMSNIQ